MPNERAKQFKNIALRAKKEKEVRNKWSIISLNDSPKSGDSDDELYTRTRNKKKSSINLGKLPTLSSEEYTFFRLVQDGDSVGLKDFMKSPSYEKININKTDQFGFSALHYAVRRQDEEMVTIFLEQAGILLYDTLFHAIEEENITITKMLLAEHDKQNPNYLEQAKIGYLLYGTQFAPPPPTTPQFYGLPKSLSPTNITSRKSLEDLEEFDSEFPTHFNELLLSARKGNYELMEIFYDRGQRLESSTEDHNCGCKCRVCERSDKTLSSAYERLHLFDALTNPKYICFISGKIKSYDPANYAIYKILKCRELEDRENMFEGKFLEYEQRLSVFLTDLVNECRSNEETETFFRVPDAATEGRLRNKYPRIWTMVGLKQVDVVAHPHTQYVLYKQWTNSYWHVGGDFVWLKTLLEMTARTIFLPFIVFILWCGKNCWCKTRLCDWLFTPASRYRNWVASYVIFLAVLTIQVMLPQRCHRSFINRLLTWKDEDEAECDERGAPHIGMEWVLVIYILGVSVSMIKRITIPWIWTSYWVFYEICILTSFFITFGCWIWAWVEKNFKEDSPEDKRDYWEQYWPEVLADAFLSIACVFAYGYVLRLVQVERHIGPLQIALGRMVKNFMSTTLVYAVVLVSFSTGLNAIYVPFNGIEGYSTHLMKYTSGDPMPPSKQLTPFGGWLRAPLELFWSLYGMSGSDRPLFNNFPTPKNNRTSSATTDPDNYDWHHPLFSERAGRTLFQCFHVLGVLMMFNMLVAYFTEGATEIIENADKHWKFARSQIHMIYLKDTVLPPPFNLIPTISGIVRFLQFCGILCKVNKDLNASVSCSPSHCCFIREPVNKMDEQNQRKAYRRLILLLIHRYNKLDTERSNQSPATSDDVKEIGEELAELKSQIQSKMREMQLEITKNLKQTEKKTPTGGGEGGAGSTMSMTTTTATKTVVEEKTKVLKRNATPPATTLTPPTPQSKPSPTVHKPNATIPKPPPPQAKPSPTLQIPQNPLQTTPPPKKVPSPKTKTPQPMDLTPSTSASTVPLAAKKAVNAVVADAEILSNLKAPPPKKSDQKINPFNVPPPRNAPPPPPPPPALPPPIESSTEPEVIVKKGSNKKK